MHLNTSHVNVNRGYLSSEEENNFNLNTSHVNVNPLNYIQETMSL